MNITPGVHLRIARPTRDLDAAERFWRDGLGLAVLFQRDASDHSLRMLGLPDDNWHIELTRRGPDSPVPTPTPDDLLVFYLNRPVPKELVDQLAQHGGKVVKSDNPYWDDWGVTIEDPDGYRLVLCELNWSNAAPPKD